MQTRTTTPAHMRDTNRNYNRDPSKGLGQGPQHGTRWGLYLEPEIGIMLGPAAQADPPTPLPPPPPTEKKIRNLTPTGCAWGSDCLRGGCRRAGFGLRPKPYTPDRKQSRRKT